MIDHFDQYTDKYSIVQNQIPDPTFPYKTSANGLLFTAEAVAVLKSYGPLTEVLRHKYLDAVRSCEVIPGLYNRWPEDTEQEAIDDYVGLIYLSQALEDPAIAEDIRSYGAQNYYQKFGIKFKYYYPNENPYDHTDVRGWLGRFPWFKTHIAFALEEKTSFFGRLAWSIAVATSGAFDEKNHAGEPDTNAWTLSYMLIKTRRENSLMCSIAEAIWRYRLKKKWHNMKSVFTKYFQSDQHPIARWAKE